MDIFSALAVPTRRNIVEILASKGRLSATDIGRHFDITAPAISQHLGVLLDTELLIVEKHAQQRIYEINPRKITEVEQWATRTTRLWEQRLDMLSDVLEENMGKRIIHQRSNDMQNNNDNKLVVTKVFDAPCELVWNAWTTPALIAKWFAPGIVMDVRELDVRTGGHFRFADPNDTSSGEYTGTYISVKPLEELSFSVMDFSEDPKGVEAGFKVVFEELGEQTKITLTSIPDENSYDERAYDAWNGCFERLAKAIQ